MKMKIKINDEDNGDFKMNSIKTKGVLFFTSLIFVIIVSLSLISYIYFKNIILEETYKSMERISEQQAILIDSFLISFLASVKQLSNTETMRSDDWDAQREILLKQINPNYLNIAVVGVDGYARYVDGLNIYLGDREYIKEMLEGETSFSNVITSRITHEPAIMVGIPIKEKSNVLGGLAVRLDTMFLSNYLLPTINQEMDRAYIISETGDFIAHATPDLVTNQFNIFQLAKENDDYLVFSDFVKDSMNTGYGHGRYEIDGEHVLMSYAIIPSTGWRVYSGTFESTALEGLYSLRNTLIILVTITLAVSAILSWFMIKFYTNPVIELQKLFARGEDGDLNIRFTSYSKDEVGRAGLSFNRMMDKIKTLTYYDPLTKLPNKIVLENDINELIKSRKAVALTMISIDQFSLINEVYGNKEADCILSEIANILKEYSSENNRVYRYKGDEFVFQFSKATSKKQLEDLAERLLKALSIPFSSVEDENKKIALNFSIGIYFNIDFQKGCQEILKALTHANNHAKSISGNSICWYDERSHINELEKRGLQSDIPFAIENNEFYLVYQPLFHLNSKKVVEAEALIRWRHHERGEIYPNQFIEIAEKTGLITSIDFWVFENVCKQLKHWQSLNMNDIMVSVNVSSQTFEQNGFVDFVNMTIETYGVDARQLQIELTERVLIQDIDASIKKLNKLRELGIKVAIDDFGIGYSSLSYIVRLPIDSVKIDRSFIKGIGKNKESDAIVTAIINMCSAINKNVIAEGIETIQELNYLENLNCHLGQGYYFSKPISAESFEKNYIL